MKNLKMIVCAMLLVTNFCACNISVKDLEEPESVPTFRKSYKEEFKWSSGDTDTIIVSSKYARNVDISDTYDDAYFVYFDINENFFFNVPMPKDAVRKIMENKDIHIAFSVDDNYDFYFIGIVRNDE
jgi:hypothetical protein